MKATLIKRLYALSRQGEDNIWRTAKDALDEITRLRLALIRIADDCDELSGCEDVAQGDRRAYHALANIARNNL